MVHRIFQTAGMVFHIVPAGQQPGAHVEHPSTHPIAIFIQSNPNVHKLFHSSIKPCTHSFQRGCHRLVTKTPAQALLVASQVQCNLQIGAQLVPPSMMCQRGQHQCPFTQMRVGNSCSETMSVWHPHKYASVCQSIKDHLLHHLGHHFTHQSSMLNLLLGSGGMGWTLTLRVTSEMWNVRQ